MNWIFRGSGRIENVVLKYAFCSENRDDAYVEVSTIYNAWGLMRMGAASLVRPVAQERPEHAVKRFMVVAACLAVSICAVAVLQGSGVARPVDMAQGTAFLSSFARLSPDKRKAQLGMVSVCAMFLTVFIAAGAPGCYENCGRVHTAAS